MFVSRRAVFLEKKKFEKGINVFKVELEEVQQVELTQFSEPIELDLMKSNQNLL